MRTAILGMVLAVLTMIASAALARPCGGTYVVQRGDSLSLIADRLYKNASLWTSIHSLNLNSIGIDPDTIPTGLALDLRCIDGRPTGLAPGQGAAPDARQVSAAAEPFLPTPGTGTATRPIRLLTGSDFAPLADRSLPGGGLMTALVEAAMQAAAPAQGFDIHWVDDWAAHHDPLLSNALLDMGFPWSKPDCAGGGGARDCADLNFSAPMLELLEQLYVLHDSTLVFHADSDLAGRTLCRPAGHPVHFLDEEGRGWLSSGLLSLVRPATAEACFRLLEDRQVDAVLLNDFLARAKIAELRLQDKVRPAGGHALSIETSHVVIHADHPEAAVLMTLFDDGLARIRADGTYQRILEAHLTRHWSDL